MTELLFECYGVPSVAYGVDALFSAYHYFTGEGRDLVDALIVSSGHQTTHILPVLHGKLDSEHCKRYLHLFDMTDVLILSQLKLNENIYILSTFIMHTPLRIQYRQYRVNLGVCILTHTYIQD